MSAPVRPLLEKIKAAREVRLSRLRQGRHGADFWSERRAYIKRRYVDERATLTHLGAEFGVSRNRMRQVMDDLGIARRSGEWRGVALSGGKKEPQR